MQDSNYLNPVHYLILLYGAGSGFGKSTLAIDSILPCWDWLYSANCFTEAVTLFPNQLYMQFAPLLEKQNLKSKQKSACA